MTRVEKRCEHGRDRRYSGTDAEAAEWTAWRDARARKGHIGTFTAVGCPLGLWAFGPLIGRRSAFFYCLLTLNVFVGDDGVDIITFICIHRDLLLRMGQALF